VIVNIVIAKSYLTRILYLIQENPGSGNF